MVLLSYYYLRRRSHGPPFPPDHRQAGERGVGSDHPVHLSVLPAEGYHLSNGVFPLETSIFLEIFPLGDDSGLSDGSGPGGSAIGRLLIRL
jgi:hypothetical protein